MTAGVEINLNVKLVLNSRHFFLAFIFERFVQDEDK